MWLGLMKRGEAFWPCFYTLETSCYVNALRIRWTLRYLRGFLAKCFLWATLEINFLILRHSAFSSRKGNWSSHSVQQFLNFSLGWSQFSMAKIVSSSLKLTVLALTTFNHFIDAISILPPYFSVSTPSYSPPSARAEMFSYDYMGFFGPVNRAEHFISVNSNQDETFFMWLRAPFFKYFIGRLG